MGRPALFLGPTGLPPHFPATCRQVQVEPSPSPCSLLPALPQSVPYRKTLGVSPGVDRLHRSQVGDAIKTTGLSRRKKLTSTFCRLRVRVWAQHVPCVRGQLHGRRAQYHGTGRRGEAQRNRAYSSSHGDPPHGPQARPRPSGMDYAASQGEGKTRKGRTGGGDPPERGISPPGTSWHDRCHDKGAPSPVYALAVRAVV